jgi:hypothetical protein
MPEALLLEKLETSDWVMENLEKVEDALRDARRVAVQTAERMKGTAPAFENVWRKIITNVAKGQTAEMQMARPGLLNDFAKWLDLLKRTHTLLSGLHKQGRTDIPAPDFLLREIAGMEQLKSHVFDCWQSTEDLEALAARDYPLTMADLDQIGPQRRPPAAWYSEESKPF